MAIAVLRSVVRGNLVRATMTFRNAAGELADPNTVSVDVKVPDGTIDTYTLAGADVIRTSLGVYYVDIPATMKGRWILRCSSTGAVVSSELGEFTVTADPFA